MFVDKAKRLFHSLWLDENGYVLCAESVMLGTICVLGATVGLGAVAHSVNEELTDVAYAFRSLDQSFQIAEIRGCGSWTAGSSFKQKSVKEAHAELAADIARMEKAAENNQERIKRDVEHQQKLHDMKNAGKEHHETEIPPPDKKFPHALESKSKPDSNKSESHKQDMKKSDSNKPEMKKQTEQEKNAKKPEQKKKHDHDDDDKDDDN